MPETDAVPELSVILPTDTDYSSLRRTVAALNRQTARHRIELVIIAPNEHPGVIHSDLSSFARVQIVNGGPVTTSNAARALGIRVATAPIVALSEDHSYPDPEWAAALIAAHDGKWAAVSPAIRNANPHSLQSWANIILEYAPWFEGIGSRGEVDEVPGHNSSYRRDLLLAYGDRLPKVLEIESVLQRELKQAGHRLFHEPAAVTSHLNFSLFAPSLMLRFNAGRAFAGYRKTGWSPGTRVKYILGAPLIPFVRLVRISGMLRRSAQYSYLLPRLLPRLCVNLFLDGLGELVGYIAGPGRSEFVLGEIEFRRERFIREADIHELDSHHAAKNEQLSDLAAIAV